MFIFLTFNYSVIYLISSLNQNQKEFESILEFHSVLRFEENASRYRITPMFKTIIYYIIFNGINVLIFTKALLQMIEPYPYKVMGNELVKIKSTKKQKTKKTTCDSIINTKYQNVP